MNKIKRLLELSVFAVCALFTACKTQVNINENANEMVKLNPVVKASERTALPNLTDVDINDFSDFYLYCYLSEEDFKTGNYENGWGSYTSLERFKNGVQSVPAGSYYFTLQAYYNGIYFYSDIYATVSQENNTLNFDLKPELSSNSFNGNVILRFYFPEGTNPVLKSARYERYNNDSINSSGNLSYSSFNEGTSEYGNPYINLQYSLYKNNTYDNYFLYFVFADEDETGIKGFFEYSTSAPLQYNNTVYEEFTVEKFLPVQTIRYHLTDAAEITEDNDNIYTAKYSPAFGFDFYENKKNNWYLDTDCTVRADNSAFAYAEDIDLYWTASKNTRKLTIKDFEGNVLKEKVIKNNCYYYFQDIDFYTSDDEEHNDYGKSKHYAQNIYKDINKTVSLNYGNSYNLEDDLTVYVELKPYNTLTVYELNASGNAEPINTAILKYGYYYLYFGYVYNGNNSYYYNGYVTDYYSDASGLVPLETGYQYTYKSDVVIYAKKDVPHTLTVKNIVTDETLITMNINMGQLYFTNTSVQTYNNNRSLSINAGRYYYDNEAKELVQMNETIYDVNEDVTVYAHPCTYITLKSTKDEENLWTSDTITDTSGNDVLTGYYSYTVENDGTYAVYLDEQGTKDSYFYIFVNEVFNTSKDDPYGERIVYELKAGDVITIKHTLYNSDHRYGGGGNMDPIPDYATEIYDTDEMRIEELALLPLN